MFLEGAGVLERLSSGNDGQRLRILEIGLGLGVNALLTAKAAQRFGTHVDYYGVEFDFQPSDVIRPVLESFKSDEVERYCSAVEQYCSFTPSKSNKLDKKERVADAEIVAVNETGADRSNQVCLNDHFNLHIIPTDLNSALESYAPSRQSNTVEFDAIYLDAFSPDTNPECWTPEILLKLSLTLSPGGKLATYCAKGSVRRALQNAGLTVTRLPGPPGKRECLSASA